MRILKLVIHAVLAIALGFTAILYLLTNHSTTQIALSCSGTWVESGSEETIYAVIEEYRPWIIWADGDGSLRAEAKNTPASIFVRALRRVGAPPMSFYQFSDDDNRLIGDIAAPLTNSR